MDTSLLLLLSDYRVILQGNILLHNISIPCGLWIVGGNAYNIIGLVEGIDFVTTMIFFSYSKLMLFVEL